MNKKSYFLSFIFVAVAVYILGTMSLWAQTLQWDRWTCYVGNNLEFLTDEDIAGIGDINSDGVPDILIGTSLQVGRYVILSGADGTVLRDVTSPGSERQGTSVAAYGDYNGDNVPDYLVGAPFADPGGRTSAGEVRLFSGSSGAILKRFQGPIANEMIGFSHTVATVGDVNGDGKADVAVGAPSADGNGITDGGKIYLFSGATATILWTSTEGAIFEDDGYGSCVDGVGDVNGDGKPDIVTGTPSADDRSGSGWAACGEVRIISGANGKTIHYLTVSDNGRIGASVTGMGGDVNGDGVPDAAFGADWYDFSGTYTFGQIVIVSGASGSVIRIIDTQQLQDSSGVSGYLFVTRLALDALGDVDGDGAPDLVNGVPQFGWGDFGQGALAIYSSATGALLDILDSDLPQSTVPNEQLGRSVAGIGDINGDGICDIAGGAPFYTPIGGDYNGRVCVFRSRPEVLIWSPFNPDVSAIHIQNALKANGKSSQITDILTPYNLAEFSYVFVCLGVYPNNRVLNTADPEVTQLVNYLNGGGRLYMEGGDTWAYDPYTALQAKFKITGLSDGSNDLNTILGVSCLPGMDFIYSGENNYIDRIAPQDTALLFHNNSDPFYNCGVAYDYSGGFYRTIGTSFQFGGLDDASASSFTKADLMAAYLNFFDNGCPYHLGVPSNLYAFNGYNGAVPLAWDAPAGFPSFEDNTGLKVADVSVDDGKQKPRTGKDRPDPPAPELALLSYNVYRSSAPGGLYFKIASGINRQYYRDQAVTNGKTYYYIATAVYDVAESGFSNEDDGVPVADGYYIKSGWTATPPVLDGFIKPDEWSSADVIDITHPDSIMPVTLYVMNDNDHLYVAVDDPGNTTLEDYDEIGIYFDEDLNREWPPDSLSGEGNLWIEWLNSSSQSLFRSIYGWWPGNINFNPQVIAPGVNEAIATGAGHVQYEVDIDLVNSDLNAAPGDVIGTFIFSLIMPGYSYSGWWPQETVISPWYSAWAMPNVYGDLELAKEAIGFNITGNIYYCLNNDPIDNAIVPALGTPYVDITDATGHYELLNLPGGDYVVKPEKEDDLGSPSAISAFDAAWILQYGVGLRTFVPCQMIAADVSGNGSVTAFDAARILQWGVGIITHFPVMPDPTHFWRFVPDDFALTMSNWMSAPDSIAYMPLNSNVVDDYKAILYGDVSGNWHPTDGDFAKSIVANVDIRLEDVYGKAGDKISLPINVNNASGIIAMNFTLKYDPQVLKAVGASLTSLTRDYIIAHAVKDGQIRVGLAGSQPIVGSGAVVNLEFEVLDTASPDATSLMEITQMVINDGSIAANIQAARFEMGSAVPDEYALHQNYPNPFNPETTIKYQLPKSGKVVLKIYNSLGQEIRILVDEEKEAGYHEIHWDGRDNRGVLVSSGVYIYQFQAGDFVSIRKMLLLM